MKRSARASSRARRTVRVQGPSAPAFRPRRAAKILVVDDDEPVRWTLGAVLTEDGYTVTLSASGAEALAVLRQTEFDVVLTDLRLGDLDGLHILDAVRGTWPDTVTLMLTGYASVESAIGALRYGAYDYLCKPCSPEDLLATVGRAVERRRLTLQVRQQMRSLETAIDTARELHSALSARLEGTTALLREREHVLVMVCTELRTSLIAIAGIVDIVLARSQTSTSGDGVPVVDQDLGAYLAQIRAEAQALAQRVNAAVQLTRTESVEVERVAVGPAVELSSLFLSA
jgi:DNA-binding response OmpR family regulator